MDSSKVEILVHIAARSTAKDDARYRALARNYLNFVPATRLELEDLPENEDDDIPVVGSWNAPTEEQVDSQRNDELRSNVEEESEVKSWASFQPGQEEGDVEDDDISEALPTPSISQEHQSSRRMSSAELSFQSAANNADSPTFQYRGITCAHLPTPAQLQVESQKSTDSYKPPRSTISDSQPEYNRPLQVQASPIRALEYLLQRQENSESASQESARSQRQRNRNETASRISSSQKSSSSDIRDFAFVGSSGSTEQASLPQKNNKPAARPPATIPGTPTPIEKPTSDIPPASVSASGKMLPPSEIHISFKLCSGNVTQVASSSSLSSGTPNVPKKTTIPEYSDYIEDTSKGPSAVPKKTTIPDSFKHIESLSSKASSNVPKKITIPVSLEHLEAPSMASKAPSSLSKKTTIPESSEHLEGPSIPKAASIAKNCPSLTSSTTNAENLPSDKSFPSSDKITIPRKSLRNIPRTPYREMKTAGNSSLALKRKWAERSTGAEVPDYTAGDSPSVIPETVIRPTKRTKFTLTRPANAPPISRSHAERPTRTPSTSTTMEQGNNPEVTETRSTPRVIEPETHLQIEYTPTETQKSANVTPRTQRSTAPFSSPLALSVLPISLQAESSPTEVKEPANVTSRKGRSTPLYNSPPCPGQLPTFLDKTEILPITPETGHAPIVPEDLITPALHALAVKAPLEKFFIPDYQKREIGNWDRGYWLVKSAGWDQSVKETCWNFLANFITQKKAGWTIWCARNEDFSEIRVRCWGVTVPYAYLLLFLASETKVRKVDTWWMSFSTPPGPVPVFGDVMVPLIKMPVRK